MVLADNSDFYLNVLDLSDNSRNSYLIQSFFAVFLFFQMINLFLLLHIAPYKPGLFNRCENNEGLTWKRIQSGIRAFIKGHYHYAYIIAFIAMSHFFTVLVFGELPFVELLFLCMVFFPIISLYTGFLTGFALENTGNIRLISIILGAFGSSVYLVLTAVRMNTQSPSNMVINIALITLMVLGSLIARSAGMAGYRLKAGE